MGWDSLKRNLLNACFGSLKADDMATYVPKWGGDPIPGIQVINTERGKRVEEGSVGVSTVELFMTVDLSDFPANPVNGDRIVFQGVNYKIFDVVEDGIGGADLYLHTKE